MEVYISERLVRTQIGNLHNTITPDNSEGEHGDVPSSIIETLLSASIPVLPIFEVAEHFSNLESRLREIILYGHRDSSISRIEDDLNMTFKGKKILPYYSFFRDKHWASQILNSNEYNPLCKAVVSINALVKNALYTPLVACGEYKKLGFVLLLPQNLQGVRKVTYYELVVLSELIKKMPNLTEYMEIVLAFETE